MDVNNEKKAIIELQGICKSFSVGKRTAKVLKGIDLSINNGEMTAIMGASGCGKSTLLNIIGCLDVAESGEYWLKGKKVTGKSQKEMAKIRNEIFGYVIQDFALIRDDTVLENIRIPLDYSKKKIDTIVKVIRVEKASKNACEPTFRRRATANCDCQGFSK